MTKNPKLKKWLKWFSKISTEVTALVRDDDIYWELQAVVRARPAINVPNPFFDMLARSFASCAVSDIRRLVKEHKDSISFTRLLRELQEYPETLSRDYWRSLFTGGAEVVADGAFDRNFGARRDYFDPAIAASDLESLRKVSNKIEIFADRRISHLDKRGQKRLPTFKDVRDCVEKLDNLCVKYHMFLKAESLGDGTMRGFYLDDWKRVFRVPWIDPNETRDAVQCPLRPSRHRRGAY